MPPCWPPPDITPAATTSSGSPMTNKRMTPRNVFAVALAFSACSPAPYTDETTGKPDESSQTTALERLCHKNASQPGGCNYGDYCQTASGYCAAAPVPTCNNFIIHGSNWDASTSTGPVIHEAVALKFAPDFTFCGTHAPIRAVFRLKAYAPAADLPTTIDGFYNRFYCVNSSGTAINATAIQNITTTNDNRNITFDVNLCLPSGTTSYTAGYFFTGGSEICVTAS